MSEFEQSAHQSAEEVFNDQPIETTPVESESTPQENVFTVKYNKEEVQVPYEEASDYIQKGLNYEKVQSRANEFEQHLNRIVQFSGYQSHDELLEAVAEAERQREREEYEAAGIDPDQFNQLIEKHPDFQYAREMKAKEEESQRFNNEANELFTEFPDLKAEQIQPEVWQMREQKGLSLLDSYLRVNFKSLAQQQEQAVIQKLQQNSMSSTGALGQEGSEHKTSYSQLSATEKAKLREQVLRGEKTNLF
jgi:hypothetical protein